MKSFLVALEHLSVINIAGQQCKEYLHGQITIDTKHFDAHTARFGAHCDFKGKMWANFIVSEYNDSFHLLMPKSAVAESLTQFKKYGVFSKVDIAQLEQDWSVFGGAGAELKSDLQALFPNLASDHLSHVANEFGQVITFNDTSERYLIGLKPDGAQRLKDLSASYRSASTKEDIMLWHKLEILAGIGFIEGATVGEFVPQMFNLQALNGIDFNKGCYMGQEVVARTKFLGKNKRALYILQAINTKDSVETQSETDKHAMNISASDILEKPVGENWRKAGTVINSAAPKGEATLLLAVLPNDTEVDDVLRLKTSLSEFRVMPLPYALE
ncbi:tRNA-modifying protein YgfZ [Glaciecola siphonariae]|uniref:tRNA-modifying protein YgfZ n=1 Tax=Glaciecola siphonariae TaxID=521012 RepID=A0ABV9M2D0_9ALTE